MASITVTQQGREIRYSNFEENAVTVGSGQAANVILEGEDIAGKHCRFERVENSFYVTDMNSVPGTVLNGSTVKRSRIHTGDIISVGGYDILFVSTGQRRGEQNPNPGVPDRGQTIYGEDKNLGGGAGYRRLQLAITGKNVNQTFPVKNPYYLIGSSKECPICLKGRGVAKQHAILVKGESGIRLINISKKKIMINGGPAEAKTVLSVNDAIGIGPFTLTLSHG